MRPGSARHAGSSTPARRPKLFYFRRNTDHGRSTKWGSTVRLTSTTGRVDFPVLAASGSNVYVGLDAHSSNGNIRLARSSNRGGTWKTTTIGTTSKSSTSGRNGYPEVSASGSTVAVTWVVDSANMAKVRISSSSGASWGTTLSLGATTSVRDVSAVGNRVGVAWVAGGVKVRIATAGLWGSVLSLPVTDGIASEHQSGPATRCSPPAPWASRTRPRSSSPRGRGRHGVKRAALRLNRARRAHGTRPIVLVDARRPSRGDRAGGEPCSGGSQPTTASGGRSVTFSRYASTHPTGQRRPVRLLALRERSPTCCGTAGGRRRRATGSTSRAGV